MPDRKLGFFVKIKEDDPALAGLTTGILPVFRELKFESDPSEIGFAFHGAGTGIGEKGSFRSGTIYASAVNSMPSRYEKIYVVSRKWMVFLKSDAV